MQWLHLASRYKPAIPAAICGISRMVGDRSTLPAKTIAIINDNANVTIAIMLHVDATITHRN
jgi:hypothetical protein